MVPAVGLVVTREALITRVLKRRAAQEGRVPVALLDVAGATPLALAVWATAPKMELPTAINGFMALTTCISARTLFSPRSERSIRR